MHTPPNNDSQELMRRIYAPDMPPCIERIASAPALQRLQDVGMHCGCEYTSFPMFQGLKKYSRYEHSIGCALIVWHFTHDVRQTIAALLHDIATPTFAHVIDFLNGDHLKQESTERGTKDFIQNSAEIMQFVQQEGLTVSDISNYHLYPIADNDSPRLSADRLEYTLSNIVNYHIAPSDAVKHWYDSLIVGENEDGEAELMFADLATAEEFCLAALQTSYIYIADEDRFAMQTLAELLKKHISRGILTQADLYQTESHVITLLIQDPEARQDWLHYRALCHIQRNSPHPDAQIIRSKKRHINPYVATQGRTATLSPRFAQALNTFLATPLDTPLWGE